MNQFTDKTVCQVDRSTWSDAALVWAKAREALTDCRMRADLANRTLADAERAEREAWDALEAKAGRGPQQVVQGSGIGPDNRQRIQVL